MGGRRGKQVGLHDRHRRNLFKLVSHVNYSSNCIDVRTDGRCGVRSEQRIKSTCGGGVLPIHLGNGSVIL